MPKLALFFLVLSSLFAACSSSNSEEANDSKNVDSEMLVTGKLIPKITCKLDNTHSYALYLPSYYDATKTYPILVAFDAHARGQMAVKRFITAAEKYGYIIIGSNNAKNGLKEVNYVINTLFNDLYALYPIDKKRVYTCGFSGGARIAASVAIYKGGIKGVIACGGGMPKAGQELSGKFDFLGLVGLNDFNYIEMKKLDKELTEKGFPSQLITFEGGHDWPSASILTKAVEWLELVAIKANLIPVNDNLIRNYISSYADSINERIVSGENYKAYLLYNVFLKDMEGLYDISDYQKSYTALLGNPQLKKEIKAHEKDRLNELNKQDEYLNWFKTNAFAQIKNEISNLKNKGEKDYLSNRFLSFMGMLSYIYTENAVNAQNKEAYQSLIEIYELVEARNPDKEFFKACQAMMDNQADKAFTYLNKAVDFGYYDVDRLQVIGYFESLRTKPEFDLIVKRVMENYRNL